MISRRTFIAIAALALAACASTTLRDTWYDPTHRGGPFRTLLVLGVSANISERRTFEDIMAARLAGTGIEAIPAYRHLPEGGKATEPELDAAMRASGADGLLMSRILAIDRRTSVSTSMAPLPVFGWYGVYSRWYPMTEVRQYDIALVETSLFAADGKRVTWSGMTETYEPTSVAKDAPGFADVIVKALQQRGLVPAGK
jgi:hypothetical protein